MSSARAADRSELRSGRDRPARAGRILVLGLGNPILGDDGVGWEVVAQLHRDGLPAGVVAGSLAVGGLALMERLLGSDLAILVDAVSTGEAAPGTVLVSPLESLPARAGGHIDSSHDASLPAALAAARAMGAEVPARVMVVGIEIEPTGTFSEALSAAVANAVPVAVERVRELAVADSPAERPAAS